jgi:hypothetical protein
MNVYALKCEVNLKPQDLYFYLNKLLYCMDGSNVLTNGFENIVCKKAP